MHRNKTDRAYLQVPCEHADQPVTISTTYRVLLNSVGQEIERAKVAMDCDRRMVCPRIAKRCGNGPGIQFEWSKCPFHRTPPSGE